MTLEHTNFCTAEKKPTDLKARRVPVGDRDVASVRDLVHRLDYVAGVQVLVLVLQESISSRFQHSSTLTGFLQLERQNVLKNYIGQLFLKRTFQPIFQIDLCLYVCTKPKYKTLQNDAKETVKKAKFFRVGRARELRYAHKISSQSHHDEDLCSIPERTLLVGEKQPPLFDPVEQEAKEAGRGQDEDARDGKLDPVYPVAHQLKRTCQNSEQNSGE